MMHNRSIRKSRWGGWFFEPRAERGPGELRQRTARALGAAILLALAFPSPPAAADELGRITFPDAVKIALENNSALVRAENDALLDRNALSQAEMRFLPDLGLGISGSRNYSRVSAEDGEGARWERSQSLHGSLSSSLVLFDGMENVAALREARLERDAGVLDLDRARQTVVFTVITGYLTLIESAEQLKVREENLAAQEGLESQVRKLYEGGERPVSDLYQQQSNVAAARLSLVDGRRSLALANVDLVQTLQLDPSGEYSFVIPPLPDTLPGGPELVPAEVIEEAFRRRPEVRSQQARLEASEQAERAAAAGRWPTLSLSAGYGTGYSSTGEEDFAGQLEEGQSASVGLSLSLPLWDRFSTKQQIERARVAVDNARLALFDLRQEVAIQVRRALLDWDAAREALVAAEARVRASGRALEAVEERYEAGVATLYEVTLARADYVDAASAQVGARYGLLWQERLLDYYAGDLEIEGGLLP